MENFDRQRFYKYAKWDLTINKVFYRNMALVIFFTMLGITVCSFLSRWGMYKMAVSDFYNPVSYVAEAGFTCATLFSIFVFGLLVASGCVFHPLRNKQGRISNLTIPATSLEKYLWHVGICVIGAIVVGVASVAVCDGLNALMAVSTIGKEAVSSIFATTFNPVNWVPVFKVSMETADSEISGYFNNLLCSSTLLIYATVILQAGIYAFGNSVKYKYNIPITYVILQITGFILFILFIVVVSVLCNYSNGISDEAFESFGKSLPVIIYIVAALLILLGVLFFVWAYKRYTRAQLTSSFNK